MEKFVVFGKYCEDAIIKREPFREQHLNRLKKLKDHKNMIANLKKGDRVVTQGGIIGNIHYVNDDGTLSVEIADNVQVKVAKGMIADIAAK